MQQVLCQHSPSCFLYYIFGCVVYASHWRLANPQCFPAALLWAFSLTVQNLVQPCRILEGRTPERMNYILREYNCNFGSEMYTCNATQYIFAFQMLLWWVAETLSTGEPAVFFLKMCLFFFHVALTSVWKLSQAAARVQTVFLLLTQEDRLWSHLAAGALPSSSRSTLSSSNIRAGMFRTFWVSDPSRFHERSLKCNNVLWKYMGKCLFNMYF